MILGDYFMSDHVFRGGIQKGTTASSEKSIKLDRQIRNISKEIANIIPGYVPGHNKHKPLFEGVYSGCMPDGGIWLDSNNRVRVAFEAKYQKDEGNAQERHAKNYIICKAHGSDDFRYITFMTGKGAQPGGKLDVYARTMLNCENNPSYRELNKLHPTGLSFFLSVEGFTEDEVRNIMEQALV